MPFPELKFDRVYYKYLDDLRESGVTNMFGASKYLQAEFDDVDKNVAKEILADWMATFEQRHPRP